MLLSDYSKRAYGRTVRSAYLQRESSFENSRTVIIFPPKLPLGMFDMRDSYRKAIQSGRSKPIKLKFTPKKSVANDLLSMNVDAFRTSNEFTSGTSVWNSSSEASVSPAELCNPAFEEDDQTDICPIDQAIPVRDSNDNISSESTNSMYKSFSKDLCIATKPMFDFRIPKPKKRIATAKPLLTLVLFWTGKGHYRRYFYVRPVLKAVSEENCGRNFLRNTSRIVKKTLTLVYTLKLSQHTVLITAPKLPFCVFLMT